MKKHHLLTALISFLLPLLSFSQVIQWQNTIGGDDNDFLYSLDQTSDSGYILGGYSNSYISGDKTENNNGGTDYWIIKTDSEGVIQWQNTIGGVGQEQLFSIAQTSDGGFILGGKSNSNIGGDKTENCIGGADYRVVKTDSIGAIQWQNTIGGSGNDYFNSVTQTSDGGYLLGGYSASSISGDKTEASNGGNDFWIVKTDSTGDIEWQNTIGGSAEDELTSIAQTADEGYILGGYSNSNISGDKNENSNGGYDYWMVKTDSMGAIQWQKTIGGNLYDLLYSITQTTDGGFILGGKSNSNISGNKIENSNGGNDFWIVKTDSSGNIQWQNNIGGSGIDVILYLAQTTDENYILGGYSASNISGDKTENSNGGSDYWMVKITDHYNLINGYLFIDANSNWTLDAGEQTINNKKITESNAGRFSFSDQNGNYSISVLDSGYYSVAPDFINYYNAVPVTHSAVFLGIQQTDSLNNFAFQPAGVFNDLCVTITPLGPFRSGFNQSYVINYENVGTTTVNPTVIFFPDNDVSFVSANPVASTVTTDSLIWNFGPLAPFQSGQILITVNVNTGVPIGTLINSGVSIEPIAGDANPGCNQAYWEVLTTGSVDPNDILVDQDTLLSTQFPNPPFLEYLIRFQNTGNDTAFTVKVLNPIDTTKLELSTLEFVASSHPVNLSWIPWERNMQFIFNNILLPDSIVNEPASHGFVRYRIKPKTNLIAGDSITNNAAIYFDFNDFVLTNTAYTHIVLPTFLSEITLSDNLLLYPNPANTTLTIETRILPAAGSKLIISDVAGRTLLTKTLDVNSTRHQIDIASFSAGIYFVIVDAGEGVLRGRFVKE